MNIRQAIPADHDVLVDIWLRSVRATHTFLSEEDIHFFLPMVRDVELAQLEVWVLCADTGAIMGFMGMSGGKVEALFLAPEFHRCGGGRRLVRHAQELRGELTVDVNEQNPAACRFYQACGFVVEGRSELDGTGRPFPLLHLRLPGDAKSHAGAVAEEMKKFQGTWRQITWERDGVPQPPGEQGWEPRTTFTGDTFVVTLADGSTPIKGTFKLDPTREPKTVDWTDTFGPDAGKTLPAIYSLVGDRLVFCVADEGQARPTEFRTGPGQVLRVSQREAVERSGRDR